MNNSVGPNLKITVLEGSFDDKWLATISFGKGTDGTISLPGYKDIGGFHTSIQLQATGKNEFLIHSTNLIPLLIYRVERDTGKVYDIESLPLNWGKDGIGKEHWISTQAISERTNTITTVTFALCRKEGKRFTLTLIEE